MRITNEWLEITGFEVGQGVSNNGDYNVLINTSASDTNATLLQPKELVTWNEAGLFAKTKNQQSVSDLSIGNFSNFPTTGRSGLVPSISLNDLPVNDPSIAYVADPANVTFDADDKILLVRDLLNNYDLSPVSSTATPFEPHLVVGADERTRVQIPLDFGLRNNSVLGSDIAGPNGDTTTVFFVLKTKVKDDQMQVTWGTKADGENTFRMLLMRNSTGRIVVDNGDFLTGARWDKFNTTLQADTISHVCYQRDGDFANVWVNGFDEGSQEISSVIPFTTSRVLNFGYRPDPDFKSDFGFYAFFVYNRSLSIEERNAMFDFIERIWGV